MHNSSMLLFSQLEFSRHLSSVHLGGGDGSGSPQGRSAHGSGGISTIVLQADGSFSQRIQVGATESAVGSPSAAWSQTKRGRFVAVPDNTETGVLSLQFYASGVETRGRPGHGDSLLSPPGSPNTQVEATSGQLNQRWAARLEGASLLMITFLAGKTFGNRPTLTLSAGRSIRGSSCRSGLGRSQVVSRLRGSRVRTEGLSRAIRVKRLKWLRHVRSLVACGTSSTNLSPCLHRFASRTSS